MLSVKIRTNLPMFPILVILSLICNAKISNHPLFYSDLQKVALGTEPKVCRPLLVPHDVVYANVSRQHGFISCWYISFNHPKSYDL